MSSRFRISVLGDCKIVDRTTDQEIHLKSKKSRCLIALVALWPSGIMTREKLASFLWDPAPDDLARSSLRQCLKDIRDVLGPASDLILDAKRSEICIKKENVAVDVHDMVQLIDKAKTSRSAAIAAARQWQGDLFGEAIPAAPMLEAWIHVEKTRLRTLISNLLTDHLQQMIATEDFVNRDIAEELVRIEPSHELAHQFLMRYYVARGDQAGALRQFARMEELLAEELDSEPSQESLDLLVAIKRGDAFTKALPHVPLPSPKPAIGDTSSGLPKIAIRPPLTRFKDDGRDYLADGFAGLLKVSLSRFRCWIILSWPSNGFDSKIKVDYPDLGLAIGADYAIDSVLDWRQQNGQLFVSLVDCSDGSQVWSDVLEISHLELQMMSSSVAGTISAKLASRINHIALLRFTRKPPASADAYDLWLKGHQLSRSWSLKDDAEAQLLLSKAIEKDPGLACAYSSLAGVLMTQGFVRPGYEGTKDEIKRGFELAQKAVMLDPFDSRNHLSMGWSWLMARSGGRAESHFKLAVELNPYDSETLIASAMGMGFIGEHTIAKSWAEQAIALNPLHPEYFLGYLTAMQYLRGDYSAAIASVSRCLDVMIETRAWQAAAYAMLEQDTLAAEAYKGFIASFTEKWTKPTPPEQGDIEDWLQMAIPVVSSEGRALFNTGFAKARELYVAGGLPKVFA
jgi:DNA-binding SARP family transcriptional activator/TolB-like protein